MSSSSSRHGDALNMAEFKAIVTASFDDIGSHVALNNIRALHPNRLAPPPSSSEDKNKTTTTTTTRRSPLSFLRKVKSHATSLLVPHQTSTGSTPTRSFVPALVPPAPRQPTPAPFANHPNSLSRNLLTRALGKHQHGPHFPEVDEPKSCFFDDDEEEEDDVDRRLFPQTRRISTAPARPNLRLSSAFAAAPTLFGLPSPSVSTPSLIPEKHGVVRPESRADVIHVCPLFTSFFRR
jgi:hypothetical protein